MAYIAIGRNERVGICFFVDCLSNIKLNERIFFFYDKQTVDMIQEIGVFVLVALAFGFLVKKFFWKPKSANACDKDSCGCH
ncbi:hypothetical protein KH5_07520 [Urechidicola sp. KH5]